MISLNVIVTGGAGFIGSTTSELLVSRGYFPVIIDNLHSGSIDNISRILKNKKGKLVKVDVSKINEMKNALKGLMDDVRGIVHLAAMISLEEVANDPQRAFEVNVIGTLNILELARKYDIKRVVYASSVAVYGEPQRLPIDENHPKRPANLYGLTKLYGEMLLWLYKDLYGLRPIALRYFNVYGPRMRPGPYAGVIYKFIVSLLKEEPPIIYGDGNQTRDFIYVEDVAEANLKALESSYVGAVNIGTGKEVSINDLFEIISRLIGSRIRPLKAPPRLGDVRRSRADISLAKEKLEWTPRTELIEGLKKTINYYKATQGYDEL